MGGIFDIIKNPDYHFTQDDLISAAKNFFGDAKPFPAILSPGAEERMLQMTKEDNHEVPKFTISFGEGPVVELQPKGESSND